MLEVRIDVGMDRLRGAEGTVPTGVVLEGTPWPRPKQIVVCMKSYTNGLF